MRLLVRKVKMPSCILEIKTNLPCPSCLFGQAHRKQWRTNRSVKNIKKLCASGESCSVNQIAMSLSEIIPQVSEKARIDVSLAVN